MAIAPTPTPTPTPTPVPTPPPITVGIVFAAGNKGADTTLAVLAQALTVEVHDSLGKIVTGVVVRFEPVATTVAGRGAVTEVLAGRLDGKTGATLAVDSTDATGRARALIQLGMLTGTSRLVIRVPALGLVDTARFEVRAGNAKSFALSVRDTALLAGGSYKLAASVFDAYGNKRLSDVVTFAATSAVLSVDGGGTVTGVNAGRGAIAVTASGISDTARASVLPDFMLNFVNRATDGTGTSIAVVRTDGTGLQRLTTVQSFTLLPNMTAKGYSSVFYEFSPGYDAKIFAVDSARNRNQIVTTSTTLSSMWEPRVTAGGSWVYFSGNVPYTGTANALYGTALFRVHLDGSGRQRLSTGTTSVTHINPNPSADGKKLAFVNGGTISVMDLTTLAVTSLGISGAQPRFSPDGTRIVYQSSSQLYMANADGTSSKVFTPAGRFYDQYSGADWSSDGKWLVARGSTKIELYRVSDFLPLDLPFSAQYYQPTFHPLAP